MKTDSKEFSLKARSGGQGEVNGNLEGKSLAWAEVNTTTFSPAIITKSPAFCGLSLVCKST